ncbi:Uncharacterized protein QJS10_CPB14g00149 [Acorus calamus]|uniref:Single-stranded DNA binding protein Ssb-like OB fold domain-containing protein n=1 Tax=Acorus calamus TaxID=4465 RepID=A0AAV9DCZ4_ACOCL|nr:Uncharacterized protein QJS10_CPB14g00149 [Acorus calamus]
MAESKTGMRKPVFAKVNQLRPGTSGHTLTLKVVSSKMVLQKGRSDGPQMRQMRIAECLVGDETGIIVFTARNEQEDFKGADLIDAGGTRIYFQHYQFFVGDLKIESESTLEYHEPNGALDP